jgi:large subunit ribosomal protein L6
MARVLKTVTIPSGVSVSVKGQDLEVKGGKGTMTHCVHADVEIVQEGNGQRELCASRKLPAVQWRWSARHALCFSNMIKGVHEGFERKLELVGVGYRAQAQGKVLNLTLGFSHPVEYSVPEGITIETPSQTEILVKGIDKQKVGRSLRIFAAIVRQSLTRARVFVIPTNVLSVRKPRRNRVCRR